MKRNKLHNKKGFTLIEMLIAVFIFTVSLAALMSVSARALDSARDAEKQVVADYLAIEAIESVRHVRDSAFISGTGDTWLNVFVGHDLLSCSSPDDACDFYYDGYPVFQACTDCTVWNNTNNNYFHVQNGSTTSGLSKSPYRRYLYVEEISEEELLITVEVLWDGGMVSMNENLYLWF